MAPTAARASTARRTTASPTRTRRLGCRCSPCLLRKHFDCRGYGDPYDGLSPGPRYLIPGLPFFALGLGPAFARWRLPTAVLTAVSIVAGLSLSLTWAANATAHYRETVWGELLRFVTQRTESRLYGDLAKNVLVRAGPNAFVATALVYACAAAAFTVALTRPQRR